MRKELRLWASKNQECTTLSRDHFKFHRTFVETWFDSEWKGFGISSNYEAERHDGTYRLMCDNYTLGAQWTFKVGHEVHQYDGFWHRFSLGPLFITWYR